MLLFEYRLRFGELCDAIEASRDNQHLLPFFWIGNHFAEGADFPRMFEPKSYIAQYGGHLLTHSEHTGDCMHPLSLSAQITQAPEPFIVSVHRKAAFITAGGSG
ncbi:MAG: hypothetical protein WCC41_19340 [Rhodomicrobium sp.]